MATIRVHTEDISISRRRLTDIDKWKYIKTDRETEEEEEEKKLKTNPFKKKEWHKDSVRAIL